MRTRIGIALGLLLLTTACDARDPEPGPPAGGGSPAGGVLLLGDSVAAGQAAALTEAFAVSGVRFWSAATEGGGNVVGPNASAAWEALPATIEQAAPTVVVYQITTYDWGTAREQTDAYTRLSATVADAGATLVIVTMPPIRADDFHAPHLDELHRTRDSARAAADASGGRTRLLDAGEVWGGEFTPEGRSSDGVHTCPQGAARFAEWLLAKLTPVMPGLTPAPRETWVNAGWSGDRRFIGCGR
ncbi:SGNH/GDSL hydrolase family protein [Catenuloplanes atrovinosus]|uniref:Lysophospholipase L1-like esterase n=1 Tax=Catenuloplanes atrovinosus TaxID=137266 RepID=A0AAE3YNE8_9ACTN|nr:SGNH/GDSL hydrolase family protein [Catenuloplanes atrovinosus]MDR7275717.1 lysophospholipase L1-like esterase [Catenuloplanes atrovinosus]